MIVSKYFLVELKVSGKVKFLGTENNFLSYGPDVLQYLGASYDYGILSVEMIGSSILLNVLCYPV